MYVKQVSAFLENKNGRLSDILKALWKSNVKILAMSLADTSDFGILRLIVSDNEKAKEALKGDGVPARLTDVVAVAFDDQESLANLLDCFKAENICVEYMYAFTESCKRHEFTVILRVSGEDSNIFSIIEKNNIKILDEDYIKELGR